MNMDDYQEQSGKTAIFPKDKALLYLVLGLCSEAGELAGKLKKIIRDTNGEITPEKIAELADENGDCGWYQTQINTALGLKSSEVAERNLNKLNSRLARGVLGGSGDNR
jgi:NTP pyrophosphatase (non-canonical NTP hydrolase)